MKHSVAFEGISKHRAVFMGMAILCVMLCHNTLIVPAPLNKVWKILTAIFQCGVDQFMLLSGLGLYYSFKNKPDKRAFWKKRFAKILPPYLIATAVTGIIWVALLKELTLTKFLWTYSLISFYLDAKLRVWFIAGIMLLYAVFPYLYAALQKCSKIFTFSVVLCGILCVILSYINCPRVLEVINSIFINRLPAFFTGMLIAKAVLDGRNPKVPAIIAWLVWLGSAALLIWFMISPKGTSWVTVRLLFLPFCLSGMLLLVKLLDKCQKDKHPYKAFCFLGGVTLEIYLAHERIVDLLDRLWVKINFSHTILAAVSNFLAIILAVFVAWLLQKAVCDLPTALKCRKRISEK